MSILRFQDLKGAALFSRPARIKVLSSDTIKPSSPTPSHLRTFKLSSIDQIAPLNYSPIIFYYPLIDAGQDKIKQISSRLKESLSETLSLFFPLAGRIRDHLFVDCNDEGILFSEALVDCDLSEFLKEPELDSLEKFLPCSQFCLVPVQEAVQVAIRLNVFNSGGIAIGMCFLHKMVDGTTMAAFLKSWAATAGARPCSDKPVQPDYLAASQRYPPREELPSEGPLLFKESWLIKMGKGVTRRFVFSSTAISALKETLSAHEENPSRVLAVAGFFWKSATAASKIVLGPQHRKSSVVGFAVNLRPRVVPPMSESCFANVAWQALATYKAPNVGNETFELQDSVGLLRDAIRKISDIKYDGFLGLSKLREEMVELFGEDDPDAYIFSSWCKFGFYELDFGWGKPIWISNIGGSLPMFANYALLVDSRCDGIEAWVCLDERIMDVLERDPEFLAFASVNPSITIS
ncbi:hypothetical protein LguiB_025872 [Lonicera macranthoides]